jgi:hypothetical protein
VNIDSPRSSRFGTVTGSSCGELAKAEPPQNLAPALLSIKIASAGLRAAAETGKETWSRIRANPVAAAQTISSLAPLFAPALVVSLLLSRAMASSPLIGAPELSRPCVSGSGVEEAGFEKCDEHHKISLFSSPA